MVKGNIVLKPIEVFLILKKKLEMTYIFLK